MSLKAKIEAVIYASEEPVTLAQLVGLLGHEAQSQLDHLAARQQSLHLADHERAEEPEDLAAESAPESHVEQEPAPEESAAEKTRREGARA